LPSLCPNYESKKEDDENIDLIHCNKCLSSLINFEELLDFQKNEYFEKANNFYINLEKYGLKLSKKIT